MLIFLPLGCCPVSVVSGCGRLPPLPSEAVGLFHPAKETIAARSAPFDRMASMIAPASDLTPLFANADVGVGQPVSHTSSPSSALVGTFRHSEPSLWSRVVGAGHEVSAVSDVGRPDARSRENDRPAGVVQRFHVSLNKVEPSEAVLARNLLAKDNWRQKLRNEPLPSWP